MLLVNGATGDGEQAEVYVPAGVWNLVADIPSGATTVFTLTKRPTATGNKMTVYDTDDSELSLSTAVPSRMWASEGCYVTPTVGSHSGAAASLRALPVPRD